MDSMQNIDEQKLEHENLQQLEQQNTQQDMEFFEDSLASSDAEQSTSEVTFTDYLKQYEVDNVLLSLINTLTIMVQLMLVH